MCYLLIPLHLDAEFGLSRSITYGGTGTLLMSALAEISVGSSTGSSAGCTKQSLYSVETVAVYALCQRYYNEHLLQATYDAVNGLQGIK